MGGLLCKQRSRSRPPHTAHTRRKKLHGVGCLLCFIVPGEAPAPGVPAAQDCARLLCPGEESRTGGGLVRAPGLPCPAIDDMVCKRKNSGGENQQPLTPCKQPRCAPARDLSPDPERLSPDPRLEDPSTHLRNPPPNIHHGNPSPHQEDPSPNPHHGDLSPNLEDPLPNPHHKNPLSHHEDPSPNPHHGDLSPNPEDPSLNPHHEDPSPNTHHGDPLPHHEDPSPNPHHEAPSSNPHHEAPSSNAHHEDPLPNTHHEDPSPHHEDPSPNPHHEDPSPHHEDPSPNPHHEDPSSNPHHEDPLPNTHHEDPLPHHEDPSTNTHHEDPSTNTHQGDPLFHHEELSGHHDDLSPCSRKGATHLQTEDLPSHPQTEDPSLCPGGEITHPISKGRSSCTGEVTVHPMSREGSVHPKTGDLSLCPSEEAEHPQHGVVSHSSGGQGQSPSGGLACPLVEVPAPSSCDSQELHCRGTWHLMGDPALACKETHAHSTPGNWLQHSIAKQHPPLSGDLTTPFVEDQEPHSSVVKTLQSQGEGHIPGISCTGEDAHRITRDPAYCSNKIPRCSVTCPEPTPPSLAAPCLVEVPSPDYNQAASSQSPKVEVLVPCEPLHINQLPPSLLLKIFSLLSLNERCLSASLVCKYWRDLCLDFQFWKQLDLSSRQQVKDNLLEKIASRCWNITEINISDCLNVTDAGICILAMNCSGLLKYTAYRCKQLSDPSLISLATHCPSLQKVHVGNQDRLTDQALNQLGSRCKDLRDIHFGQCYKISDEGMVVIAKGCPKLQKIYMQENKLVTNRSVEAFAEHCPELQYVGFMGCSVTSHGVIHLTRLKNLSSLDLRNITELDNQTVVEIVKKCQNLTSLNLCLNRNIDDRCVEVIAKEGRSLKELYLVTCKITDHALIAIGRYSTTIETVDVGWCKEITDQGATLIAQSSKSIHYLGLMRCDQVNENTVEQLVQQYPHITFSTVLQDCKRTLERAYQMGWTPNASSVS